MSNSAWTLYTGVTNDLGRRVSEHKSGRPNGFTARYGLKQLVYFEHFSDVRDAIAREKQIKGMSRARKIQLIKSFNPEWQDLAIEED